MNNSIVCINTTIEPVYFNAKNVALTDKLSLLITKCACLSKQTNNFRKKDMINKYLRNNELIRKCQYLNKGFQLTPFEQYRLNQKKQRFRIAFSCGEYRSRTDDLLAASQTL